LGLLELIRSTRAYVTIGSALTVASVRTASVDETTVEVNHVSRARRKRDRNLQSLPLRITWSSLRSSRTGSNLVARPRTEFFNEAKRQFVLDVPPCPVDWGLVESTARTFIARQGI
jgi:hypothetical protein